MIWCLEDVHFTCVDLCGDTACRENVSVINSVILKWVYSFLFFAEIRSWTIIPLHHTVDPYFHLRLVLHFNIAPNSLEG